jgi:hypothetical protein
MSVSPEAGVDVVEINVFGAQPTSTIKQSNKLNLMREAIGTYTFYSVWLVEHQRFSLL